MSGQVSLFDALDLKSSKAASRVEEIVGAGFDVKKFVENFEVLANSAGSVSEFRQLIVKLAVRGRLVTPEEKGSVDELFASINQKRAKLVDSRKASRVGEPLPIDHTDVPFPVPSSWRWVRFGQATICRDGQRIPVSKEQRQGRQGRYDYYGASGVIDQVDDFIFDEPLLLVGEDGANLVSRSTPIAFIASGKYWVNNHAHVLDSYSTDMLRYLAIFINAIDLRPYVTGTAQPKMNQAKMNGICVAVPPVAEQNRIVAKVDQLMALCDDLEARQTKKREVGTRLTKSALEALTTAEGPEEFDAAWKRVVENFDLFIKCSDHIAKLRTTLHDLALRGRLVRQDSGDLPPTLPRSVRDVADADLPRPFQVPLTWTWATVDRICRDSFYGPRFGRADYVRLGGTPTIRTTDMTDSGEIVLRDTPHVRVDSQKLKLYQVERDDLLITRSGSIGTMAVFAGDYTAIPSAYLIRFRFCNESVSSWFVYTFFRSSFGQASLGLGSTTTAQPNVNASAIRAIPIPLPPLAEQKRIVAKLGQLMRVCDDLEAKLRRTEDCATRFAKAVVVDLIVGET